MNLQEAEKLMGVLANETRLRLLRTLAVVDKAVCVCELEDALDLPQYSVSRHLQKLKESGLVESRREGTWAYYSLATELNPAKREVINWVGSYLDEEAVRKDRKEMKQRLSLRKDGKCVAGRGEESDCK
ncbi:MAG: ArsR/SmtB family transcription factor [Candidatus Bipolaricaulia bacterium]